MFDDLITPKPAPPNRASFCAAGIEEHLFEGAVIVAFATHLLRTTPGLMHVSIHPDGEHGNQFSFRDWFERRGFDLVEKRGKAFGGLYRSRAGQSVLVNPKPGRGDVVADFAGQSILAECKGGILNTRHPGQQSRLRRGLCEAVGQCLKFPLVEGMTQFAVAPRTSVTEELARRMTPRVKKAGVEIVLVDGGGNVCQVT